MYIPNRYIHNAASESGQSRTYYLWWLQVLEAQVITLSQGNFQGNIEDCLAEIR